MHRLRGAARQANDPLAVIAALPADTTVLLDVGTGDGRFVDQFARANPACYALGIDACRENLRAAIRRAPPNAGYLIANALALPPALSSTARLITINFPWGSLLQGLLQPELGVVAQLAALARSGALLDIHLNAGALATAGWTLATGSEQVRHVLQQHGFSNVRLTALDAAALRTVPTTWARRLAFGRDPRACHLQASYRV